MKPLLRFQQKKFCSLSSSGQAKALAKLLSALAGAATEPALFAELSAAAADCLAWLRPPTDPNLLALQALLRAEAGPHRVLAAIDAWRAGQGQTQTDRQLEIIRGDAPREADPAKLARAAGITVILDNLRSVFNVGSIFRTAECLGIGTIYPCGITATPAHPALAKTARGTSERVGWKHFPTPAEAIGAARRDGCLICALETASGAQSVFEACLPVPLALVLGNESLGLSEATLALCDRCVRLPVQGWKNSLNVASAFAVCAYQIVFGNRSPEVENE